MAKKAPEKSVSVARGAGRPPASSERDADATRADILAVAIEEFSAKGLAAHAVSGCRRGDARWVTRCDPHEQLL
jgi:hypothetical protein